MIDEKKTNYTIKQRLKYIFFGILCVIFGSSWSGGSFKGIFNEFSGETQHVPPFNLIYVLFLLFIALAGLVLAITGLFLMFYPPIAFKIIDLFKPIEKKSNGENKV